MPSTILETIYSANHASFAALGYSPIPIKAGEKRPAIGRWQAGSDRMPTQAEHDAWSRIPGAGIGICLGTRIGEYQVIAIDLDVDRDDLDKLCSALPASPMEKVGRKGLTRYFLACPSIKTTRYKSTDGRGLADLQAHGTQTVMPPSPHPAGCYYVYTAGPVPAADLHVLTFDDLDRFEDALEGLGWQSGVRTPAVLTEAAQTAPEGFVDDETDCGLLAHYREINERALADPGCYVPLLGLYNCRPKAGGYTAVADWRPSRNGNRIEERKRNLSIHITGIVDFGTGQGYSPIDLVMAARGDDLETAANFLCEKTRLKAEQDEWFAWFDPWFRASLARWAALTEAEKAARRVEAQALLRPPTTGLLIERHGEPSSCAPVRWLIKNRLYEKGVALFAGPSGGAKTFSAIHAAVGFATGTPVFGELVRKRVGTLFVLGEGKASMRRRLQAASLAVVDPADGVDLGALPISFAELTIESSAKRDILIAAARDEAVRMREHHGIDLGIVVVDTLAACCLFKDENDAADAQRVMDGLSTISRELDCLVIATAHYGKSAETGVRGSSALTASPDTIWALEVDKCGHVVRHRQMVVAKVRDAEPGEAVPFELQSVRVGEDEDGEPLFSAFIALTDEPALVSVPREQRLSQGARAYLAAFDAVFAEAQDARPFGADGPVVRAVDREIVRREFYAAYPADGDTPAKQAEAKRKAFNNGERSLVSRSKIVTRQLGEATLVWKQQ